MNKAEEIIKRLIDDNKINGEEAIILIKSIQNPSTTSTPISPITYTPAYIHPTPPTCDTSSDITNSTIKW